MTNPAIAPVIHDAGPRPTDSEIDVHGLTHPGLVRPQNEDHFLICTLQKKIEVRHTSLPDMSQLAGSERMAFFAMVADGVGGAAAGEEASRLALEGVTRYVSQALQCFYNGDSANDSSFMQELEDAALKVHNELYAAAAENRELRGMATTLTLWIGIWPRAYLVQVGDSRCYSLRKGNLIQMSRDQTMAEEMVEEGVMKRADVAGSRLSHVLSSAIGGPQAAPVVRRMQQEWESVELICSDGLTRHVSDERIRERLLTMTSARQACEALLQDALDDGGRDNITIIVGRKIPAEKH